MVDRENIAENREQQSSQELYIAELNNQLASIPDPETLAQRHPNDNSLTRYCTNSEYIGSREGEPSLFLPDFMDNSYCEGADAFVTQLRGISGMTVHAYETALKQEGWSPGKAQAKSWQETYVNYMRQRRAFHITYMNALVNGDPELLSDHFHNQEMVRLPLSRSYPAEFSETPQYLYNLENWTLTSTLNVLTLPPHKCSAEMKKNAIAFLVPLIDTQQWPAKESTLEEESPDFGINPITLERLASKQDVIRLPRSMHITHKEHTSTNHPDWRNNPIYQEYFGPRHAEKAGALSRLLHDRPNDYVQILVLRSLTSFNIKKSVEELKATALLDPAFQEVIFDKDASFNTIFDQPNNSQEVIGQQLGVLDALRGKSGELPPDLVRQLFEQAQAQIDALRGDNHLLRDQLDEMRQREYEREQAEAQRRPYEQLCQKYGVNPNAEPSLFKLIIDTVRRELAKIYHPNGGTNPNEEMLKTINQELDIILRARGL